MTYEVLEQINAMADDIFAEGIEAERIGRVADDTAKKMKAIGSIRMLQPKEHGGMEAHPREFAETVMRMASLNPSAGWVHGIVGVHPWQLAFADPKVQQEIWGSDPDTWMASPYMPGGMCIPTDGGYKFSGRWQFSSGTDHCDWAFLGAMACDKDGNMEMPPRMLHVIIPRTDYEIIEDSWDVMGLRGTGSKDLVVKDAYVPDYRVMDCDEVIDGTAVRKYGRTETLYLMPWSNIFPLGITAATIGICEGMLFHANEYQADRINAQGTAIKDDPYTLFAIGQATADIRAARDTLLANVDRMWDRVDAGKEVTFEQRAEGRQTQVQAAWRAVNAIDQVYPRCGGNALRMDKPLQRFWRDAHAGQHHAIHVPSTVFHAASLSRLGADPQGPLRAMI
ncbi:MULTISPECIES: acyl-CoA dehydrogenase family protein [Rhodococcus]|jgi:alkylation response protein AidB-like acyl-CoA dehydrogenase|uniref:Acyl-CoA dehydrogenase family protein n=2 Tax=Rhodococcus qingshengii TaxID=334542 RepID=A0AAW6LFG1_RHOSG|nr:MULTISPECIES: acyl-CoA dehydrogenase family protein [Rhodococcus]EEN85873.1 acyl-CoA dehydrogenase, C-terminal domain protein [Rhodococcus erythropolis SK121]KLN72441.1 hydroxylase [Rhodococcus erythropolis]NHE67014.1 hydroxylase [Rhodococcus sp. D-46]ANQ72433.1 hydroxylase [Rhodococcus sp. 008]ARE33077.1 hydroxylase [Rhodococcus sp. BH4]|eukprot:gene16983-20211_t